MDLREAEGATLAKRAFSPNDARDAFGHLVLVNLFAKVLKGVDLAELLRADGSGDNRIVDAAIGAEQEAIAPDGCFHLGVENVQQLCGGVGHRYLWDVRDAVILPRILVLRMFAAPIFLKANSYKINSDSRHY